VKTLFSTLALILLVCGLAACNLTQAKPNDVQPSLDPNEIATRVQNLLSTVPGQTNIPAQGTAIPASSPLTPSATPLFASLTPAVTGLTDTPPAAPSTATPTSQPTTGVTAAPTAQPTAANNTPAPTAVSTADPRSSLGNPTRADTFDTSDHWFPFSDNHIKIEIANSALDLTALKPDGWTGWSLSSPKLTNFYLEVTAKPAACDGFDSYGPMLRAPDATHGYLFAVSCDGQYRFEKVSGNNISDLIGWTANPAIGKGADQTNRLGVIAKGDQFTLFVNGSQVGQVSDSAYASGAFGLFISSFKTLNFVVHVDEVDYWDLP
jgi:hypothetical protein